MMMADHNARREGAEASDPDWSSYTFEFLIERVLEKQSVHIREQVARLEKLASAEPRQRQGSDPSLGNVGQELSALADDVLIELAEEECVFPFLLKLEQAYMGEYPGYSRHLRGIFDRLALQSDLNLRKLDALRKRASGGHPEGGRARDLCGRLDVLETELEEHMHLEADVLFPRAAQMETELFRNSN